MDKERIKYIDIARGIAMLCIVLGHLGNSQINRVVFTFHVPLFFFITGYFINNRRSVKDFIKNKARTLLAPYCWTCLVIILIAIIKNVILYGSDAAKQAALEWLYASVYCAGDSYSEPLVIKQIGAIWFLWATFWGSIFLRCTLEMKKGTRLTTIMILFAMGRWSRRLLWFPFSIQAGCCAVLFMYFGFLLRGVIEEIKRASLESKVMIALFAFWIWGDFIKNFQSFWLVHCDIGRGSIDILGSICGCYIILLFSWYLEKHNNKVSRALAFVGKNSLFVLCLHVVELDMFPWRSWAQKLIVYGFPSKLEFYIILIGKFIFIIGAQ